MKNHPNSKNRKRRTLKIIDLSSVSDYAFKIEFGSSYLTGYLSNCDFPRENCKKTRGEIFYVNVDTKRSGIGTNLCINALELMKSVGTTTVVMNAVTNNGKKLIESLIHKGHISKPIKISETGKMEFIIL